MPVVDTTERADQLAETWNCLTDARMVCVFGNGRGKTCRVT